MSASQGDDAGADAIGLQLLMAGGFADAMAAAEATLGSVQRAAERALGGLATVQAAGSSLAAVPPPAIGPSEAVAGPPAAGAEASVVAPPPPVTVRPTTMTPAPWTAAISDTVAGPMYAPVPTVTAMPATRAPAPAPPARVAFSSFAPSVADGAPMPAYVENSDASDTDPAAYRTPSAFVGERQVTSVRDQQPSAPMPSAAAAFVPDAATPMRAMAPPPATTTTAGPTGGDVFLDGTRMGTWLADHLAREAGRPQAGGTGFDSRLTAAWPGTLQGG